MFDPTYAMYAQIPRTIGTSVLRGTRDLVTGWCGRGPVLRAREGTDVYSPCSPNNPTGTVDPIELWSRFSMWRRAMADGFVVDEAYGQFASTSVVDCWPKTDLSWSVELSPRRGPWPGPLGILLAPTWCVAELEKVALPYHLDP
ncbi:MAG: hypothetical protein Ct9H300mP12_04920 [Acidimicrobiales bacterium]|nr:MAG: hypothetical protein Ct9H300mP12_04920 [Acidimicrobiales bacterium]